MQIIKRENNQLMIEHGSVFVYFTRYLISNGYVLLIDGRNELVATITEFAAHDFLTEWENMKNEF